MAQRQLSDGAAHVLIIPYPAQGHISPILKFAELLSLAASDFHITFVNTEHSHRLLLRHADRFARYPRFRFKTITDGLPDDHPRSSAGLRCGWELFWSFMETGGAQLRELITSTSKPRGGDENAPPQISCMIADGTMVFPVDVGKEVGVPVISFSTLPASCFWTQFCIPQITKSAELPTKGSNMDNLITSIPSMEGIVRGRDLPSFFRVDDLGNSSLLQHTARQVTRSLEAHALIFNSYEDLEAPVLFQIRSQFPGTVHTIGPIAAHLEAKLMKLQKSSPISTSLREEDKSCMPWLDVQAPKSVIYVSFGSTTTMSGDELMEIYHGLINSECKFLWVIRSDMIKHDGTSQTIPEEVTGMKERGFIVGWAPQEEVLAHPAVGAFFTHSGWNSTLESIVAGKPMICWPFFADQQMNSRFVSEVWKLGLDMKDNISREIVERLVRDVMIQRRDDFAGSAMEMAESVRRCVGIGGSSHRALNDLICDIRLISANVQGLKIN